MVIITDLGQKQKQKKKKKKKDENTTDLPETLQMPLLCRFS